MPRTIRFDSMIAPGDPAVRVMSSYHSSVGRHDHDFYELVYVTEGFCLHDAGGVVSLLMEGDLFVIKPGISHKYMGNGITRIYNCIFKREALDGMEALSALPGLDRLFDGNGSDVAPRLHLTLNERKVFLRLLGDMAEECVAREAGWRVKTPCLLGCVLAEYSRAYSRHVLDDEEGGVYSAYVAQAIAYVNERYADCELSVHGIAESVGVSSDYLSRQFRRVIGIAAQEYLRRYRFARAMELLQAGVAVGDVASQVGFRSLCNFSREFKREMGMTPSQYKNQND